MPFCYTMHWFTLGKITSGAVYDCFVYLLNFSFFNDSEENQSPETRHAYSIHVVEGTSDVEYPSQNWLQRGKELPFRCIYDHVKDTTLSA